MLQEETFSGIYKEHAPKVLRICRAYTDDADQANDYLQETFIKVWQSLGKFRGEASISTWIYRITVNTCLSHIRSNKHKGALPLFENYDVADDLTGIEKEQHVTQLYKAIHQLSESDRLIISMVLEEIPYSDIAAAVDISEGNLRVKIHRIKQTLTSIFFQS